MAGITQDFVLEMARDLPVPVREVVMRDRDVLDAKEAFLTSTTREVTPVVRVDDTVIGTGRPGPVTLRLLAEYRR